MDAWADQGIGFGRLFGPNVTLAGGPAPLRAYIEQLPADGRAWAIDALDTGVRGGPEPEHITRATFGIQVPEA